MSSRQYALYCLLRAALYREYALDAADQGWRRFWLLKARAAIAEARANNAFYTLARC